MVSLSAVVYLIVLAASFCEGWRYLNLPEGASCGSGSVCMRFAQCTTNIRQNRIRVDVCSVDGKSFTYCCRTARESSTTPSSPANPRRTTPPSRPTAVGAKARAKCAEYAKYVYRYDKNPLLGGEPIKRDLCVKLQGLIVHGVEAAPKEFPHMALIGYGEKETWDCGGSLISERFVISAAHCDTHPQLGEARWARLGEYDTETMNDNRVGMAGSVDYKIIQRIPHPNYSAKSLYYDISLYKLESNVQFGEFIRPICLQVDPQISYPDALATGWGLIQQSGPRSNILQKVNLTLGVSQTCRNSYKNDKKMVSGIRTDIQFCAGSDGKDACQGDSGGPLQVKKEGVYCMHSLLGVVSTGKGCGQHPGLYTKISSFIQFIETHVWP